MSRSAADQGDSSDIRDAIRLKHNLVRVLETLAGRIAPSYKGAVVKSKPAAMRGRKASGLLDQASADSGVAASPHLRCAAVNSVRASRSAWRVVGDQDFLRRRFRDNRIVRPFRLQVGGGFTQFRCGAARRRDHTGRA